MAANQPDPGRILSIQSHVVTGYVGNRSATFPLQLLGWEVDVVNTTQLSNHTGYRRFGGMRLDADHLQSVFEGMDSNGLLRYGRVLSGYTPSPTALDVVMRFVQRLRSRNPDLVYLLDPVMGDMDRGFYVDKECLPLYQTLMACATIICPNQFEAQALAGEEIASLASLKRVLRRLHAQGPPSVIITSVVLPAADVEAMGAQGKDGMILVGSTYTDGAAWQPWFIQFPELDEYFVGVGDLFSALTLGRYKEEQGAADKGPPRSPRATSAARTVDGPLARATELAVAGVQSVLQATQRASEAMPWPADVAQWQEAERRVETMRRRELRLVQSRDAIEHPTVVHRAQWLP